MGDMPPSPPPAAADSDADLRPVRSEAPGEGPGEALTATERRVLEQVGDEDLMKGCQEGSFDCFEILYERYHRQALSFVHRILRDFQRTESIAQEAFLRIFRDAASYEYPRKFSTWFYTILRNLTKNELRYRSRHPATSMESEVAPSDEGRLRIVDYLDDGASGPLERLLDHEVEGRLQRAIDALSDEEREVLVLHRFQKLKYREIVEVVDQPLGTVRSRLHNALNKLRLAMKDLL